MEYQNILDRYLQVTNHRETENSLKVGRTQKRKKEGRTKERNWETNKNKKKRKIKERGYIEKNFEKRTL